VSKKEIRRAARDAYPALKAGAASKRRGTGGAYSKRQIAVGGNRKKSSQGTAARGAARSVAARPPSWKRAITMGVIMAGLYFVLIQWVLPHYFTSFKSGAAQNIYVAVVAAVVFPLVLYWSDRLRYRRYLSKHGGSNK
jgi:hypothetical protein